MRSTWYIAFGLIIIPTVVAFSPPHRASNSGTHHDLIVRTRDMMCGRTVTTTTALSAKPQRLAENVDGVVYVNDRVSYVL